MIIYDKDGNEIKCDSSQLEQMLDAGYTLETTKAVKKTVSKVDVKVEEIKEKPKKVVRPKKDIIL